jgi:hypothetical protein
MQVQVHALPKYSAKFHACKSIATIQRIIVQHAGCLHLFAGINPPCINQKVRLVHLDQDSLHSLMHI